MPTFKTEALRLVSNVQLVKRTKVDSGSSLASHSTLLMPLSDPMNSVIILHGSCLYKQTWPSIAVLLLCLDSKIDCDNTVGLSQITLQLSIFYNYANICKLSNKVHHKSLPTNKTSAGTNVQFVH